jgi:hypothetical protein
MEDLQQSSVEGPPGGHGTAPGPKNYKLGSQLKLLKDKDAVIKKKASLKTKPPTKTKFSSTMKSDSGKNLKISYSSQRLQLNTLKSSLIQSESQASVGKPNASEDERNKRKSIHYSSVGRQPGAQVLSQKKQVTRQSSLNGASPAQKRMSEQKSHYLKIQNIQQRVLDYSHGRDKDAQVPLTNQS